MGRLPKGHNISARDHNSDAIETHPKNDVTALQTQRSSCQLPPERTMPCDCEISSPPAPDRCEDEQQVLGLLCWTHRAALSLSFRRISVRCYYSMLILF